MKILVTGSTGMLGSNLIKSLTYPNVVGYDSEKLDITDLGQVKDILTSQQPNVIIHTAAHTNVEDCEINNEKAYLINTIGTQNLVNCCINKDILFIYISSTGIYGTKKVKERYNEFDEVNPTTIHHKSKYEAEKIVQNHLSKFLILRTGWLFGGNIKHSKNFVYKRYLESKNKKSLNSDNSQIGNPTYIKDFVEQITLLIDKKQFGIFNCVSEAENISRFDYVKKIVELFDIDCKVEKASSGMFKRVAKVSNNESAINYKLNLLNLNIMDNWENSLSAYIKDMKKET